VNCSRFETLLTDYMDQALDMRAQSAAEEHARRCQLCADLVKQVQALRSELTAFPLFDPPPRLLHSIMEKTTGPVPRQRSFWHDLVWPTIKPFLSGHYAFGAAMLFVFFSLMLNFLGPSVWAWDMNSFRPAAMLDRVDRMNSEVMKRWAQFDNAKDSFVGELRLLKQDLYGRLDYYMITLLFDQGEGNQQEEPPDQPDPAPKDQPANP
jgi:hypothetical protein